MTKRIGAGHGASTRHEDQRLSRSESGQILALFVVGLFAVIAMVALVIEGSNLFAQQRIAQNGADAASNSGTIIVAEYLSGKDRTDQQVFDAVEAAAAANGLSDYEAEYTDDFGNPIGVDVQAIDQPVPDGAEGVRVGADRRVGTHFAGLLGINSLTASAEATVVAGALSGECVEDEEGCTLLPVTFPILTFNCDDDGNLIPGDYTSVGPPGDPPDPSIRYWPLVSAEQLPGGTFGPDGDVDNMAILPLCRESGESTGTFGWLDLLPGMNLAQEIEGPLDTTIDLPNWFQTQTGNPNSVEDEILAYWRQPVLIPLYNQTCRTDPGDPDPVTGEPASCNDPGVNGNNTWYFVHTLVVFYIEHVFVQGGNIDECMSEPGYPPVLDADTGGAGFLGCLKGWFVNYVTAGPITPGEDYDRGTRPIGIQLIR
jgi:hypothetical protein